MCMEDIRVMRKTITKQSRIVAGGSVIGTLVMADPYRVALAIQYTGDNPMYLWFGSPSFDGQVVGWKISGSDGELWLDIQRYGAMLTTGLYFFCSADGGAFIVVETTLDKE